MAGVRQSYAAVTLVFHHFQSGVLHVENSVAHVLQPCTASLENRSKDLAQHTQLSVAEIFLTISLKEWMRACGMALAMEELKQMMEQLSMR